MERLNACLQQRWSSWQTTQTISASLRTVRVDAAWWGIGQTSSSRRKSYVSTPHNEEQDESARVVGCVRVGRTERGQQWALTTRAPSGRLCRYKSKPLAQGKGIEPFTSQNPLTDLTIGGFESGIPLPTLIYCAGSRCMRSWLSPTSSRLRVRSRSLGHNLPTSLLRPPLHVDDHLPLAQDQVIPTHRPRDKVHNK